MKRALYITLVVINISLAFLLLLSYLSTLISPARLWILAFFGLLYPYLLVANIMFIVLWIVKPKKVVFVSVLVILLGWNHLNNYIPVKRFFSGPRKELPAEAGSDLRIISYNVRAFNVYEWVDDSNVKDNIINFIRSERPDIVCLQEYYTDNRKSSLSDQILKILSETPFQHIQYTMTTGLNRGYGMATFSRYPIAEKGSIRFSNTSNMAIYTDIIVDKDTFRVYNNHLQSINLHKRNYDFIDSLRFRYDERQFEELKDITKRLRNAFIKRSVQVDSLSAHIKTSPFPVIVCGDFNDTPVSYTYRKMRLGLKDSFVHSGAGTGNTYLGVFPSFRIDYIFHSPSFITIDFERVKATLSDHYPIICHLRYAAGSE